MNLILTSSAFLLSALIGLGSTGYFTRDADADKTIAKSLTAESTTKAIGRDTLSGALLAVVLNSTATGKSGQSAEAIRALASAPLSNREELLAQRLGSDESGRTLFAALRAANLDVDFPEAKNMRLAFVAELRARPDVGLRMIKDGLDRIDAKAFPFERLSLIEALSAIPGRQAEVNQIALHELVSNPVEARPLFESAKSEDDANRSLSTTHALNLPLMAYGVFLSTASNPEEALEGTVQGLLTQSDRKLRRNIAQTFVRKFPALEVELSQAMASHGVQLPSLSREENE